MSEQKKEKISRLTIIRVNGSNGEMFKAIKINVVGVIVLLRVKDEKM